jgi:hypothetical protein
MFIDNCSCLGKGALYSDALFHFWRTSFAEPTALIVWNPAFREHTRPHLLIVLVEYQSN